MPILTNKTIFLGQFWQFEKCWHLFVNSHFWWIWQFGQSLRNFSNFYKLSNFDLVNFDIATNLIILAISTNYTIQQFVTILVIFWQSISPNILNFGIILDYYDNLDHFWQIWQFWQILTIVNFFWQLFAFFYNLTIFDKFYNFWKKNCKCEFLTN